MCGGLRGEERPHGATPRHPSGAEPKQRGGITPPTGQRPQGAEGRGDGGEGAGGKAYERGQWPRQIACGRSAPSNGRGEEISARARDARTRWTSGTNNERRRAWRAVASATQQNAPSLWRVERPRGDTQRTPDSQARSVAERAAGWPRSGWGVAQPPEEGVVASDESGQAEHVRGNDSQARSVAERAAGWPRCERSEHRVTRQNYSATGDTWVLVIFASVPKILP